MSTDALSLVAPFASPLARRRVSEAGAGALAPHEDRGHGHVLIADISGFTALTERFAQRGPAGAEELKTVLDAIFGKLDDIVARHGGDLLHFAGDAAMALFDGPGVNAVPCAFDILASLEGAAFSGSDPLRLRIGLGSGARRTFVVGGIESRWEALLAGAALDRAVAALGEARNGEVVLDGKRLTPGPAARDTAPPASSAALRDLSLDESILRAFLPRSMLRRLDAGQRDWLAEFRRVTCTFMSPRGIDLESDSSLSSLDRAVRIVQAEVFRQDGSLLQALVDDKGLTLLAVWGLSLHTHEDDAVRAVSAARAIRDRLAAERVPSSIGVATGLAFAGVRGGSHRREYSVLGDVVNLAARLAHASGDTVLCDDATRVAGRRRLVFQRRSSMALKGKLQPVTVFEPLADRARTTPGQPALVGRERERRVLGDALTGLDRDRDAQVMIVEGEPGVGKSRLVSALVASALGTSCRVVTGAGDAVRSNTAYHVWQPVVSRLLGFETSPSAARARLEALCEHEAPAIARYLPVLNAVLPFTLEETRETSRLTAEGRAERTRELIVWLIDRVLDRGPVLVLLEDAHWFDSASWAVAETAALRLRRALLVLTTRPALVDTLPPEAVRLHSSTLTTRLKLEPLAEAATVQLLAQQLDVDDVPELLARWVYQKTEGHPLFIEELTRTLRDRAVVSMANGECSLTCSPEELDRISLPQTVEGLVTARIDRLEPDQQLTFKVAAVIGRRFTLAMLRAIHPLQPDEAQLARQLEPMVALGLLNPIADPAAPAFEFKHAIIERAAYEMLPFAQRRPLHAAAATWHERTAGDAGTLPLLAYHWTRAGNAVKSLEYLERAAEEALYRDGNREAVQFLTQTLEIADEQRDAAVVPTVRRARWHRQLGEAHHLLRHNADAADHLRRALALLGTSVPPPSAGRAFLLARHAATQGLHLLRGTRPTQLSPEQHRRQTEAALTAGQLAWVLTDQGDGPGVLLASLASVNLADRAGETSFLATALLGYTAAEMGMPRLADRYFSRGRSRAYEINAKHDLVLFSIWEAMARFGAAQVLEFRRITSEAIATAAYIKARNAGARCHSLLAGLESFLGEFEQAEQHGRIAVDLVREDEAFDRIFCVLNSTAALIEQPEKGVAQFEDARPFFDRAIEPKFTAAKVSVSGLETLLYSRAGQWARAKEPARRSVDLVKKVQLPSQLWIAVYGPLEAALLACESRNGDRDWEALAASALTLAKRLARRNPVYRPRTLTFEGRLARLAGQTDRAIKLWQQSILESTRLSLAFDEALARLELARATPSEGGHHLDRARALFAHRAALYQLRRVEEAASARRP